MAGRPGAHGTRKQLHRMAIQASEKKFQKAASLYLCLKQILGVVLGGGDAGKRWDWGGKERLQKPLQGEDRTQLALKKRGWGVAEEQAVPLKGRGHSVC